MPSPNHIAVSGLSKTFPTDSWELTALADVNLTVRQGEFLSIIGPSGCGKTTLLKIIGGLMEPTTGWVHVGEAGPAEAQRRKELGFVFQDPSILPWRTVLDNVGLPLRVNKRGQHQASARAEELVEAVGLSEFSRYYPHQLSSGMKQRVALARALVFNPTVLLMDEPLGSLDEITRDLMRYELLRLWEATRKTVLMVTHSVTEAIILSDRVAVMSGRPGRIKQVIDIDIPRPRDESVERSEPFLDYTYRVKGLLADGGVDGPAVAGAGVRS